MGSNNFLSTLKKSESGGATVTTQAVLLSSDFTTSSTSFVDITGFSMTMPDNTGSAMITVGLNFHKSNVDNFQFRFVNDTTNEDSTIQYTWVGGGTWTNYARTTTVSNDGQAVKCQVLSASGSLTLGGGSTSRSTMRSLEVG